MGNYVGEIFALITSVMWVISAMAFESAGKKIGSLPLNLIRLVFAFVFISIYTFFSRGMFFATDVDLNSFLWLALSGVIGFVIGDIMLFQAYVVVGARISTLIMSLVPAITALLGWLILGETLSPKQIIAMVIAMSGIFIVLFGRGKNTDPNQKKNKKAIVIGLLLALGGAIGQAGGLVVSKKGMGTYDAFASTQIRIITGIICFAIILTFAKKWKKTFAGLKNFSAVKSISLGAFVGPFLGVSFSLIAVKYTETGIAATLSSLAPVLIILPSMIFFKEKVKLIEVVGAVVSVIGVALFFL